MKSHWLTSSLVAFTVLLCLASRRASGTDNYAYEVTSTAQFGIIDLYTGVFTLKGTMQATLGGLGSYQGILYGYGQGTGTLYRVNPKNGKLTVVGNAPFIYGGLGSTTSGLYGFDQKFDLYSIDPNTGAVASIGPTGLSVPGGFGVSTGSDTLYVTVGSPIGCGNTNTTLYAVDTTTAAVSKLGITGLPCGSGGSVFEGGTLYAGGNISPIAVWTLNTTNAATTFVANVSGAGSYFYGLAPVNPVTPSLTVAITVQDVTTGKPISNGETLNALDNFQVTVTTNDTDCVGQFVVTALGAPGAPPSVLVQAVPYIIGPNSGSESATGGILTAGVLPTGFNDWKISTTCNGAVRRQFAASHFEFFVNLGSE
jgi:hypothetical protein